MRKPHPLHGAPTPLVLLEGPDGAGKSTLALALARALPALRVSHGQMVGYEGWALAAQNAFVALPAYLGLGAVVSDRSWLSEGVYRRALGDGPDRILPYSRMLLRLALSTEHLLVRCTAEVDELWQTISARLKDELPQRLEQLERIVAGYDELYQQTPLRGVTVNRMTSVDDNVRLVVGTLGRLTTYAGTGGAEGDDLYVRERCRDFSMVGNLYGLRRGWSGRRPVLLIGGRVNDTSLGLPFIDFHDGGCSKWLSGFLDKLKVDEGRLVWVNANDETGTPRPYLGQFLQDFVVPRVAGVIYLGREAEKLGLNPFESGARVSSAEHPQYLRRFKHDVEPWRTELGDALLNLT